jgi:hypothetical protein
VGHPRKGGRRPLVEAADRAPTSGRQLRVAQFGRPPVGAAVARPATEGRPPAAGRSLSVQTGCDCASCGLHICFNLFFWKKR